MAAVLQSRIASPWCASGGKRAFDLGVAAVGLLVAAPLMGALAVAVKATSPGPIFFRQTRTGLRGNPFTLMKFRTMRTDAAPGPKITPGGDPRVTGLGRWLRKTKLDELPQLVNVLRGDMSLVGPRPDLPKIWAAAGKRERQVLSLRPGLTGAASLAFRNEEDLLAQSPPERLTHFYLA